MLVATLSDDGTLLLPKALRKHLALKPGDSVEFLFGNADKQAVLKPAKAIEDDLAGCLSAYRLASPVSIEDMRETVQACAARRSAR